MNRYIGPGLRGPCGVGVHHPPGTWLCSPAGKLPEQHTLGDFMEVLPCRHDQLLTPHPALFPLQENFGGGAGAENSKLLIMACSFQ